MSCFDPLGVSVDLWGRSEDLMNFSVNTCTYFRYRSALEFECLNMWTNMRVHFLDKLVLGNKIYMKFDDQVHPTPPKPLFCDSK